MYMYVQDTPFLLELDLVSIKIAKYSAQEVHTFHFHSALNFRVYTLIYAQKVVFFESLIRRYLFAHLFILFRFFSCLP